MNCSFDSHTSVNFSIYINYVTVHPKSNTKRWVELKWTKIKLVPEQNILFSYPKKGQIKIIE